ncbi:MAG: methionyl-tRNA formyltransferase [Chloroflexi bacterium]|nr:methionyl-tRNA formyltransferase [Chloroflexota bacterium]
MAIVFLGTPDFAVPCLRALVEAGFDITAVYTQPDRPAGRGRRPRAPPVKEAALAHGLTVGQPAGLRDPETVSELAALKPEAMVACAFGQILRQDVLDIAPRGVLNVHPALLPRHRGASPIPAAILAGDDATGVTVMLMDAGMDTGPVLGQRAVPISPFDTAGTLAEKLAPLAAALTVETLPRWLKGEIEPQPQHDSQATVAPLLKKEHGAIDWRQPAVHIWRQVRAYNPWPGAYTAFQGELLHIWEAWPLSGDTGSEPGTVVPLSPAQTEALPPEAKGAAFGVQTGKGVLAVITVQRAGRRALPAGDFLRGMRDFTGKRLVTG